METVARRNLDLLASSRTRFAPYTAQGPASALFRGRDDDEEFFARVRRAAGRAAAGQVRRGDPDRVPTRASAVPRFKKALLVDPDISAGGVGPIEAALRLVADVEVCTDFQDARARLLYQPPDLLITNLRLEAHNGLHLVHLAAATRTSCIVFSTHDDLGFARDVQAAGAFFELSVRLPHVLESYVKATLPDHDRRDVTMLGRLPLRGGRRCTDL